MPCDVVPHGGEVSAGMAEQQILFLDHPGGQVLEAAGQFSLLEGFLQSAVAIGRLGMGGSGIVQLEGGVKYEPGGRGLVLSLKRHRPHSPRTAGCRIKGGGG